jgi:hypothetical protein
MSVLQRGSRGQVVGHWQAFLQDRGLLLGAVDGDFGDQTQRATMRFQSSRRLPADGVVGPLTFAAAARLGFVPSPDAERPHAPTPPSILPSTSPNDFFPPKPSFPPLAGTAQRQQVFGAFAYRPAPTTSNPEALVITDGWDHANITSVEVPGLAGIPYGWGHGVSNGRMQFHRRAAPQLVALWRAWSEANLIGHILTFDGAFNPRFQRGSHTALSNHSFGSAFDINATWNGLSHPPARVGAKGSVMELVSIANRHGFYWGGHFSSRADGMHFEVAVIQG